MIFNTPIEARLVAELLEAKRKHRQLDSDANPEVGFGWMLTPCEAQDWLGDILSRCDFPDSYDPADMQTLLNLLTCMKPIADWLHYVKTFRTSPDRPPFYSLLSSCRGPLTNHFVLMMNPVEIRNTRRTTAVPRTGATLIELDEDAPDTRNPFERFFNDCQERFPQFIEWSITSDPLQGGEAPHRMEFHIEWAMMEYILVNRLDFDTTGRRNADLESRALAEWLQRDFVRHGEVLGLTVYDCDWDRLISSRQFHFTLNLRLTTSNERNRRNQNRRTNSDRNWWNRGPRYNH